MTIRLTLTVIGLLSIALLALAPVLAPLSQNAQADTTKKFPPVNLINDLGQYTPMKIWFYKSTSGVSVQKLSDTWYYSAAPTLTIHVEKVFKIRVAEDTLIYKTVKKTYYHGISMIDFELFKCCGEDYELNQISQYQSTYDGATNYKVTYLLNQHNLNCLTADEKAGIITPAAGQKITSEPIIVIEFTDGTEATYTAEINVIGANAYDNPC